jgi:hypothetical protein
MGVLELLGAAVLAGAVPTCPATTVHYQATSVGKPWMSSNGVSANLFYYAGRVLMDGRVNQSNGAVMYTGGGTRAYPTKILWRVSAWHRSARTMALQATRVDGPGAFTLRLRGAGGTSLFPSIVNVPSPGCWRFVLRSGKVRVTFIVRAVDPPAQQNCDATPVFDRTPPHPRFGPITWMPATPSTSGIAAVLFVTTVPGSDRAQIYTEGHFPSGSPSTKFLWWSPSAGATLRIRGVRLDGPGSFAQDANSATGTSPPVTGPIFPSIVNVPTAGCWAVTLRTGGRAGLVVFEAVPSG